MTLKLTEFLKREIKPFLYGAFLSRIMMEKKDGESYFYAYTNFRTSKAVFREDFDFKGYASILAEKFNKFSGYHQWQVTRATDSEIEIRFYLLNDLNISPKHFYTLLSQSLYKCPWLFSEYMGESHKSFIRGFMELRGSVDTTSKLIAQDYYYNSRIELKKAMLLTEFMHLPMEYSNFNMRDLQPQFVAGTNKRNTQFRINLYFYAREIGFINDYKALIFKNAYRQTQEFKKELITFFPTILPASRGENINFIKYLNFFTNNIYEKNLTKEAVSSLREKLGFKEKEKKTEKRRNKTIVELFSLITPDKCAVCDTETTFINKSTGKHYFEIHHVISFCNGQDFDNIANLVKLCPTCHNLLKRGRAEKAIQLKAISKILKEHNEIFEFCSSYFGTDNLENVAEEIWKNLG